MCLVVCLVRTRHYCMLPPGAYRWSYGPIIVCAEFPSVVHHTVQGTVRAVKCVHSFLGFHFICTVLPTLGVLVFPPTIPHSNGCDHFPGSPKYPSVNTIIQSGFILCFSMYTGIHSGAVPPPPTGRVEEMMRSRSS